MSNQAMNAHIMFGEPCGDNEGIIEIADWAGCQLLFARELLAAVTPERLEDVRGESWHEARDRFLAGKA